MNKTNLAIFASGGGSNAEKIIAHFKNHPSIEVNVVVCNNPEAGVINIAKANGIELLLIQNNFCKNPGALLAELAQRKIEWVILAGFLRKIPAEFIEQYRGRIINIHPALLPNYGGKGMYGHFVHEAVIANKEAQSGITIHYVDEQYDHGKTILQVSCPVLPDDTPEQLAKRVLQLEHAHFAKEIERVIIGQAK